MKEGITMSQGMQQANDVVEMNSVLQIANRVKLTDCVASDDDPHLIELLRNGNEAAFVALIDRYYDTMVRLAMFYVTAWQVAEEVVQETWMSVFEHLGHFEGRSSLKTWMFRILINCAKTRAQCEGRSIPFSSHSGNSTDRAELAVEPDRFLPADHHRAGHWVSVKREEMPEERLLAQETRMCLERAIEALPPNQREIISLRDIDGWTSDEICSTLGISEGNQRVLLHRARSKVRSALERYFQEE
jgi:RNA polymerase sigma-70 factor, ECF subfamily